MSSQDKLMPTEWVAIEYGYEKISIQDGRGTEIGFVHRRRDADLIISAVQALHPTTDVSTDGLVELCQQLRRNTKDTTAFCPEPIYRNPEGPKAADAIEALQRSNASLREALEYLLSAADAVNDDNHSVVDPDAIITAHKALEDREIG